MISSSVPREHHHNEPTRRRLLAMGSLCLIAPGQAMSQRSAVALSARGRKSCIILLLNGAPSQLDTFDPHPDAPADVRGLFAPIATRVPGVFLTEIFPKLAARADKFSIIRSMHHDALASHENGMQHLFGRPGRPSLGSVVASRFGPGNGVPPYVMLGGPLGLESSGEAVADALASEPATVLESDAASPFAKRVLLARRLVECGARLVVVNMFDSLLGQVTWDCHDLGGTLASTLDHYKSVLGPQLDCALSALLDDLSASGLLDDTLVLCMGEMGRAPRIGVRTQGGVGAGPHGRDHWAGVWSILAAGGGVQGGRIVGSSDKLGAAPRERPVTPAEIVATVYECLGVGVPVPTPEMRSVQELF